MRLEVAEYLAKVKHSVRIPKGTSPVPCRGGTCGNREIYMVRGATRADADKPVSIAWYGAHTGIAPTSTEDGAGISHFADCPDADHFHRKGRKK